MADLIVALHFTFVLFVVLGGLLALRWPSLAYLHLPAALWGAWIELTGRICPLTPLENALALRAGQAGYQGSFIEHYLVPIIYPDGLTPRVQWGLAALVAGLNLAIYGWSWARPRTRAA